MKGRITLELPAMGTDRLDLPPHILSQVIDMVIDGRQLASPDREQLLAHLVECFYCQVALGMVVVVMELDSDVDESSKEEIRQLLTWLTEIIHDTLAQETIGAYIDVLDPRGEEEANKDFPILAEHLKHCKSCRSTVEGTHTFLHQPEQADPITPPQIETSG